jgi:penicillin-binding protein-related factor A (putative recombinase)
MKNNKKESPIQAEILQYLGAISYIRKVVTANKAGTLDIFGCFRGLFFSLEVKQPGEGASTLQAVNIQKIRENGGLAFVVSSLDEVKNIFNILQIISCTKHTVKSYKSYNIRKIRWKKQLKIY